MNEQVSEKPKDRWLWVVGIVAILAIVLYFGFQTAIQMEEGGGDAGAASAPAS